MSWYVTAYFVLLALGVLTGAFRYYILTPGCRYFFGLLTVTVGIEAIAWQVGNVYHSNLIVYRLLIPIQYTLVTLGYKSELRALSRVAVVSIILVAAVWMVDFGQSIRSITEQYPTVTRTLCSLLIIGWTLLYLNELLRTDAQASFVSFPLFWFSVGWLLFSVVNLTYFATVNYLGLHGRDFLVIFSNIRVVSNFVLYTIFIIAFLTKQHVISQV